MDLQCSLFQVGKCGYEGCDIRNPDADDVPIGLEVYRQHIAGEGSGRLPRNVKRDEVG